MNISSGSTNGRNYSIGWTTNTAGTMIWWEIWNGGFFLAKTTLDQFALSSILPSQCIVFVPIWSNDWWDLSIFIYNHCFWIGSIWWFTFLYLIWFTKRSDLEFTWRCHFITKLISLTRIKIKEMLSYR